MRKKEEAKPAHPLEEKLRDIISLELGVDAVEITPSAHLVDDLGADSLDEVELVMAVEEAFDIDISDDDIEAFGDLRTVQDILDCLDKKTKK